MIGSDFQQVFVATAPSQLKIESDGAFGYTGCPSAFVKTLNLIVNGIVIDTQTRDVKSIREAQQVPFVFTVDLKPGQDGIPTSGETIWKIGLQSVEFKEFQQYLQLYTLNILVR